MNKRTEIILFMSVAVLAFILLLVEAHAVHIKDIPLANSIFLCFLLCLIWMIMQIMEDYTPKHKKKLKKPKICSYEHYYKFHYN